MKDCPDCRDKDRHYNTLMRDCLEVKAERDRLKTALQMIGKITQPHNMFTGDIHHLAKDALEGKKK